MTLSFKRTQIGIVAGVAVGLMLLVLVLAAKRPQAVRRLVASDAEAPFAAVALARRMPIQSTLALSGEFKPFQEVDLHAKVAGYIHSISVDVGDRVRAGQILAVLEVPELVAQSQGAQASLERAKSSHDAAHSAYSRLKQASEARPGLIAEQELEDAFAKDKEAEGQVAVAEAGLRQVNALWDYSRITAPFAGVVTKRYADTGALIQAGTSSNTQAMPVVQLAEYDRLRLVLPVPESAVPQIHLGTTVTVKVPALNRTFEGRVARFADDLDRQTRTMETEIDVNNQDSSLVAGMYAETLLELARRNSALTIPVQALSRTGSSATVLLVGENNRLQERSVKLGLEGNRRVEILAGLEQGDRVVIGSRSQFRPGDVIRPQPIADVVDDESGDH